MIAVLQSYWEAKAIFPHLIFENLPEKDGILIALWNLNTGHL